MFFWNWKFWVNDDHSSVKTKTFSNFLSNSDNIDALQDLLKEKEFRDLKILQKKDSSIIKTYDYTFSDHTDEVWFPGDKSYVYKGTKSNAGVSRNLYFYPDDTPLVSNSYLKKHYLSKSTLTYDESVKLTFLMERRRHLMEWYSSYNFNDALQRHLLQREIPLFKKEHPVFSFIFSKLKSTASLFRDEFFWDNIVTHYIMYTRHGIIRLRARLVEDLPWEHIQGKHVKKSNSNVQQGRWDKAKLRSLYYDLKDNELKRINYNTRLLMDKHWNFHDPYHYRNSWIYPPEGFIFEHKRRHHRDIWYFQWHDLFAALNEIRKFKRVKRHKRRVEKSWHYMYDKRISLKDKFLKFVKGDLWLQTKFDTKTLNMTWGDVEKNEEAYKDSFVSGQFNLYSHFVTHRWWKQRYNPHVARFKKFSKLDKYWNWIKPKCYGNRVFLEDYYAPWLRFKIKTRQPFWGSPENPDMFWFKYSHSEYTYFRLRNGQRLKSSYFVPGSPYSRHFEYMYLRVWSSYWQGRPPGISSKHYFEKNPNGTWNIRIPDVLLPDGLWTKYYTYAGPQFWFFDYSLIATDYWGEYYGPLHLPYSVKYDLFYKLHIQTETFILFNRFIYYFFSQKIFFIFNLKILWFVFFISFICFLWFSFFTSELMEMSYCFKTCSKIPDMATLKLANSDRWLSVMLDWDTKEDAQERHNFNWFLLSNYILPIFFIFMFSTFFRLECDYLQLNNWYGYFLWAGCFATMYWIKIFILWLPLEIIEEAENTITPEQYRKAWAHERKLTHDMEKEYIEKLEAGLEAAGVKNYKASWIYQRIVQSLPSVKR